MQLSPNQPLCWKDAVVPMEFQNETSCILVRDKLAKDLRADLNARNVQISLQCKEFDEKKPPVTPLSVSLAPELTHMTHVK